MIFLITICTQNFVFSPSEIFLGVISFLQLATNTCLLVLPHINTTRQNKSFKHWHNHKKLINARSLNFLPPYINILTKYLKLCSKSNPHASTKPKNVKGFKGCYLLASTKPHQKQRPWKLNPMHQYNCNEHFVKTWFSQLHSYDYILK